VTGTKLFQKPRSPLIEGRSRVVQPLWWDWLVGAAWGAAAGAAVGAYRGWSAGDSLAAGALSGLVLALPGALIAAGAVASLARKWGSRKPMVGAAIAAVLVGVTSVWILDSIAL
jgi:phosphotransferase system  glucose/maltose/N-acetylglucosamine-specific IIC component